VSRANLLTVALIIVTIAMLMTFLPQCVTGCANPDIPMRWSADK
jgi:hypothetical protein